MINLGLFYVEFLLFSACGELDTKYIEWSTIFHHRY